MERSRRQGARRMERRGLCQAFQAMQLQVIYRLLVSTDNYASLTPQLFGHVHAFAFLARAVTHHESSDPAECFTARY